MTGWARLVRLLAGIGWEIGAGVFLAFVGVSAVNVVAPLLVALGLRPLIDGVVTDQRSDVLLGAAVSATGLVLWALGPTTYRWAMIRMRERSIMVIQRRLLVLATAAPRLEHFERPEFFDRLQVLQRSSYELAMGLTLLLLGPVVVIQTAVSAGILGRLEPVLGLLPLLALPAASIGRRAEALRRNAELETAEDRRLTHHLFAVTTDPRSAKEVRVYGLDNEMLSRHAHHSRAMHRGLERALARSVLLTMSGWALFSAGYLGSVVLVLRRAAQGAVTPGDVALTLALATALVAAANQLSQLAGSALRSRTASEHYHWLADQAAPATAGMPATPVPQRLTSGIELDHVSFTYAGAERPALCDVTLRIPAGAVVAVVGENGAGKTTLVKILTGMYAPERGRVLIDGIDLAEVDPVEWRERVTAGFQDFMRFELIAAEAVGVGDLPRLTDRPAIEEALQGAHAAFTGRLPAGLDTPLGRAWDGGVDLSGGEWQKLAIARSLMRARPLLTVLDEPTASLDPQSEHALFEEVSRASRRGDAAGHITLIISHRFSTVRMADIIVVLRDGTVVESGSHQQLISHDGLYAELYRLQAAAYR